jgi:hypothetical protein
MEQRTRAWGHRWLNSSTVRLLGVPLKLALVRARAPPNSRATLRMKGLSGTRMPGRGAGVSQTAGPCCDAGAPLGWRTNAQHARVERVAQRSGQAIQHERHRACEALRGCVSRRRVRDSLSGRMGPQAGARLAGAAPASRWAGAECVRSGPRPA